MQVLLPKGDGYANANVTSRKRDAKGNPIGSRHNSALLDIRIYNVEFADGTQQNYDAHAIAENLYTHVDEEGHEYLLMQDIIDHQLDALAVLKEDGWIQRGLNKHHCKTTEASKLLVQWKDRPSTWEKLKDMKESNHIEAAEYCKYSC